ncbi:GTPase and tRNA-U34 5-formylation enzyme TrmE [Richelia intracellularis HM01]|uniref:tRNA uridine-5-carboxymethylaminomethyl(34) synthesis GTPase MnmE n=1 Tax=Richelia intracellularis TaxID=1164990 RepID=UPI0002B59784|nr:tRNA uridine-5-carboxymethylaminomethyl(34) synthesis GTPase MnmE [Richelia intracellularis]CCH65857.1 GTPase and tRNA-U34 5-formylation enzyme TrmE [Richelia intracellularis HM01]
MSEIFATTGTIAAIATAIVPQQGSIGVVRVSGTSAMYIAQTLFKTPGKQSWESHHILYGHICNPETKQVVDEALLLIMQAPRSYTCEDVVEFHCHGGVIVVKQVLRLCLENGARLARAGEFTLRAFLNGRLDLTQAESISDLVGARSPEAAQYALAGLQGKLAHSIYNLRAKCLDILAEIEAQIDFEEDLTPLDPKRIVRQIEQVATDITELIATADKGQLLRTGLKVAIVGRPNVGKSSLLNAWSQNDRAIVTDIPGTTRDVVESELLLKGIPIQVLDTAGIRETQDQVEKIGVERSLKAANAADLILFIIDASQGWTVEDEGIYAQVKHYPLILVINKIDLLDEDQINALKLQIQEPAFQICTAVGKNQGIDSLEMAIFEIIQLGKAQTTDMELVINQRQQAALIRAKILLKEVQTTIFGKLPLDFWTIDLRGAIDALGEITGENITESLLDRIFSKFCIGK